MVQRSPAEGIKGQLDRRAKKSEGTTDLLDEVEVVQVLDFALDELEDKVLVLNLLLGEIVDDGGWHCRVPVLRFLDLHGIACEL